MARKRKAKARVSYDPRCANRCDRGWLQVKEHRMGREYKSVVRCSCVRITKISPEPKPAKKRESGHDAKAAAAGEQ